MKSSEKRLLEAVFGIGERSYLFDPNLHPLPPLVRLDRFLNPFAVEGVDILAAPLYGPLVPNVKMLMVRYMLEKAREEDKLNDVHTLVEATSGNTGLCLGILAPYYGVHKVVPVVQRDTAPGKLEQLRLAGLEPPQYPMEGLGGVETARRLGKQKGWLNLGQYSSRTNWEAHYLYTGRHIWKQTKGRISLFCAGLGTTGTVIGVSRYLREHNHRVAVIGTVCDPQSAVPGVRTLERLKEVSLDWRSALDKIVLMNTKLSYKTSLELCRSGIMAGPSSGFALAGLHQFLKEKMTRPDLSPDALRDLRNAEGRVVAVFACGDTPLPYLEKYSTILDPEDFEPRDFRQLIS